MEKPYHGHRCKLSDQKGGLFTKNSSCLFIRVTPAAVLMLLLISTSIPAMAAEYYIDSGTTLQQVSDMDLSPGDSVFFQRGTSWAGSLTINSSGSDQNRLNFGAYGTGNQPVLRNIRLNGTYVTISDLTVDGNKDANDAVRIRSVNCNLKNMTIRNGTRDGIDAHDSDNLLIEDCYIYNFLNGSFNDQQDAHGIVVTGTQGVTIRGTEVHHVSGDSFQADPNRDADNLTDNIIIENCEFWTGPLTENFNAGWLKTDHLQDSQKQYPGENAIDTKVVKNDWNEASRMQLTIKDTIIHGWKKDGFINNKAALNLKEKINAVIDNVTVYDSEIGFRIRGTRGNANVTIQNSHIYNCEYAVRSEDNLSNLNIVDSVFGENNTMLLPVASSTNFDTWLITDNNFLDSKFSQASDTSNKIISYDEYIALTGIQSLIANAGTNQTVSDSDDDGTENVTLSGDLSTDSEGTIDSYIWTEYGDQIGTGLTPLISFSVGTHTITLTITNDAGLSATDTITVIVEDATQDNTYDVDDLGNQNGSDNDSCFIDSILQ